MVVNLPVLICLSYASPVKVQSFEGRGHAWGFLKSEGQPGSRPNWACLLSPLQGPFTMQVVPDAHRLSEFHTSSPAATTAPAASAGLFGGRVGSTAGGLPGLPLYGHEAPETSVRTQHLLEALAARAGPSAHGPISLVPGEIFDDAGWAWWESSGYSSGWAWQS